MIRTVTYDTATHKIVPIKSNGAWIDNLIKKNGEPSVEMTIDDMHNLVNELLDAAPEYQEPDLVNFDFDQNWANVDGAIAWHLIDRHADGWAEVWRMMNDWLKANQEPTKDDNV